MLAIDQPGSGDCEAHIAEWGQPVLAVSSVAYVLAGIAAVVWAYRHKSSHGEAWLYCAGLIAAGLGSVDYHGPALGPEPLLHDGGLALALIVGLGIDLRRLDVRPLLRVHGLVALTVAAFVLLYLFPAASPAMAGVAAVGLVVAEVMVYRRHLRPVRPALFAALGCLAVGGLVFSLSRTGGVLCHPDSWFQGHAVWHVMTALALFLWAVTAFTREDGQ